MQRLVGVARLDLYFALGAAAGIGGSVPLDSWAYYLSQRKAHSIAFVVAFVVLGIVSWSF